MSTMHETFKGHPLWTGASIEELENAGEGLEKYLMTKLYSRTFASVPEELEHDQRVYEKLRLLQQFIRPEHLDIPPKFQNESSWLLAQKDIQRINTYKNPRDKLQCILSCSTVIMNVSLAADETPPGADEFLPVLIYVIIKANPPQLYSNLMFIQRYRHHSRLVSEAAYFFTNLVSVESFIENLDAASLSMDEKEFQKNMASAKEFLEATSLPGALDVLPEQSQKQASERFDAQNVTTSRPASSSETKLSVQKLQANGSSSVLQADNSGHFVREYPFLYATVGDLRVEDVETLLNDYKELVLKYYALYKAVEELGLDEDILNVGKFKHVSSVSRQPKGEQIINQGVLGTAKIIADESMNRQNLSETEVPRQATGEHGVMHSGVLEAVQDTVDEKLNVQEVLETDDARTYALDVNIEEKIYSEMPEAKGSKELFENSAGNNQASLDHMPEVLASLMNEDSKN
ncbi:hypothetical protein KP509_04G053400 [Ceratopteris richardii]|nr:hypothetical protein KP509_04G053400 [Ceratopteris richardii]